ncbi:S-adenosylmethionine mitochondrial carrier protein isoform X1 [Oxyura jamaicensis]|uniref:S-adenosylmethionine mitochondrial carrier protein isoform X1 n=2 Tax=Oxyura jamaicensis TaxID=8884 RepID=UPI0015A6C857|nr:S-adenosylmethionine mitochondrial carrier protein isoform X1 [Oxyura jamaicensis]
MHSGARRPPDRGSEAPRWPRPCGARSLRGPRPSSPSPRAVPGRAVPCRAVPGRRAVLPPAHGAAGVVGGPGGWWSCWCLCRLDPFSSGHRQNQTAKSPRVLEGWWLSWHLCWCSLHCYRILSKWSPVQFNWDRTASFLPFPSTSAAFFITYENVKSVLPRGSASYLTPVTHMVAASSGEVVACLIRVPSEVVKQRAQVSPSASTFRILSHTLYHEGIQGLYRGYKSTVLREIPFSLVQFPLWEALKDLWSWKQGHVVDSWQSAVCGAFAGGFAAAVTTPLDVAKTRIMLAKAGSATASGNVLAALGGIWRTQGLSGLFAGVVPRMAAISLGGFIFLGTYEKTRELLL